MSSRFQVRTIRMFNGTRRAMLCERATGFPMFQPTLYLTTQVYLSGGEYNTQIGHLSAIHFLYVWSERSKIDLEKSFAQGNFLSLLQIESLNRDIRHDLRYYLDDSLDSILGMSATPKKSAPRFRRYRPRKKIGVAVNNVEGTTTIKLTYVRLYLNWLATEVISRVSARDSSHQSMLQAKEYSGPRFEDNSLRW